MKKYYGQPGMKGIAGGYTSRRFLPKRSMVNKYNPYASGYAIPGEVWQESKKGKVSVTPQLRWGFGRAKYVKVTPWAPSGTMWVGEPKTFEGLGSLSGGLGCDCQPDGLGTDWRTNAPSIFAQAEQKYIETSKWPLNYPNFTKVDLNAADKAIYTDAVSKTTLATRAAMLAGVIPFITHNEIGSTGKYYSAWYNNSNKTLKVKIYHKVNLVTEAAGLLKGAACVAAAIKGGATAEVAAKYCKEKDQGMVESSGEVSSIGTLALVGGGALLALKLLKVF